MNNDVKYLMLKDCFKTWVVKYSNAQKFKVEFNTDGYSILGKDAKIGMSFTNKNNINYGTNANIVEKVNLLISKLLNEDIYWEDDKVCFNYDQNVQHLLEELFDNISQVIGNKLLTDEEIELINSKLQND